MTKDEISAQLTVISLKGHNYARVRYKGLPYVIHMHRYEWDRVLDEHKQIVYIKEPTKKVTHD